jgi:UDP-GlcNAc:undecaprenyl-phosphate/decaprenyl-phosphate GlcNAc-1-phosphate transferase
MTPTELDALYAFLVAAAVAALLTPLTIRLARRVGAIDQPRERGLSDRETPRLGGLAIFVAAAVAGVIWLPHSGPWAGILLAATLITLVGALDDRFDFHPLVKLIGQIAAAVVAVAVGGVHIQSITLPFFGALNFPNAGPALAAVGLVGMMNVVNFSDGVDGLAAGVCAIVGIAFAVIAFSLNEHAHAGGVLAAITAGAAIGFLFHNFPPASSFMGDSGSNLLGLLMGCIAVEGDLKTSAVVTLALPLILLAVPFLDTTFVVLKRLKYRRPVYAADQEHLHHRLADRLQRSPHRPLLLRLDVDARRLRGRAPFHPLLRPPRPPACRGHGARGRARAARHRRERLPDLRPRDPQAQSLRATDLAHGPACVARRTRGRDRLERRGPGGLAGRHAATPRRTA